MRMAVKKCSVKSCMSCSSRKEDVGVTYHKYPKDVSLREAWAEVTHTDFGSIELTTFVCSRHFRKSDFQIYKDSKYVLKSDAIPSIFPWATMDTDTDSTKTYDKNIEIGTEKSKTETHVAMDINLDDDSKEEVKALNSSKESDGENVDAIRKYIEEQEKEIELLSSSQGQSESPQKDNDKKEVSEEMKVAEEVNVKEALIEHLEGKDETMAVASSVIDMILSESEARIAKKDDTVQPKHQLTTPEKGNSSVALSVGSQVEAKDFGEFWYPAEIVEVDYDEMEVLVRYDNPSKSKKHDEWISVSSPRLRPRSLNPPEEAPQTIAEAELEKPAPLLEAVKEELKVEEKPKQTFTVGERCLARWRDNRRFIATITKDLGDGNYEIVFDDGFQWKCPTLRLYKYKENLSVDTGSLTPSSSVPSPIQHGSGPSASLPPYHTHLFDPNRDYLGSKSERREMKRKLNIKEIFNIGQKKKKKNPEDNKTPEPKAPRIKKIPEDTKTPDSKAPKVKKSSEEKTNSEQKLPKVSTSKKTKTVKKKITLAPPAETAIKPKNEVPDAVASIIGTVNEDDIQLDEKEKFESNQTAQSTMVDDSTEVKARDEIAIENAPTVTPSVFSESEKNEEEVNNATNVHVDKTSTEIDTLVLESETTVDHDMTVVESEVLVDNNIENVEIEASNAEIAPNEISTTIKSEDAAIAKTENINGSPSAIPEEEVKLEKFEKQDEVKHEEVIDKIKEVITKIEDDLNKVDVESPKVEVKDEIQPAGEIKEKKKLSKIKKGKKLRLLQEKKVKKQVEKVKSELEVMKKQVEEMRKQMMLKAGEGEGPLQMPESFLLPGEWCCKWVNGQPVGKVCELETEVRDGTKVGLPRRSVQVEDKRLPEGWTKHMVRRSLGNSAGKWDVVLVSPDNRRFHTKTDMRNYLENNPNSEALKPFEHAIMDFGVHLKLSRRMGWYTTTPGGTDDTPVLTLPAGTLSSTSPLVKRRSLSLKSRSRPIKIKMKEKKRKLAKPRILGGIRPVPTEAVMSSTDGDYMIVDTSDSAPPSDPPIEDGYVWVGSLKVQIIENLLRCPAEGCFKNFRNNTLIQMHIKHYHRDLRKMLGRTPKVADLAYARTMPTDAEIPKIKDIELKPIKVKITRLPKKEEPKQEIKQEIQVETPTPMKEIELPKQDSPKLRHALINKPVRRPKVLLPVRRPEPEADLEPKVEEMEVDDPISEPLQLVEDFEAAISTHTVTKPVGLDRSRDMKVMSEDDDWGNMNSDVDTQSSFPRSGTPDSKSMEMKYMDHKLASSESNEDQKDSDRYTFTESGERVKIVHMKREEIINCHCGFREEDGLMVQCELCLCWQHALCHNIQKESEVPEKYTCSICLNPRRGRRSKRFLHDQDRLYEGLLPGARPAEGLRRSHELAGNLLRIHDALHALTVKYHVATKKDHPKLYLWAKDWENGDISLTQDRLNADYSDLNIMINTIGKENLPVKPDDLNHTMDDDHERLSQPVMLNGLLSSPSGSRSLELPISTAEIERLARSVQEQELPRAPQPEAAIENGPCRERLLRHIQRCQALIDARLDSIEAQVAELESQDPSFEDDETADYFPRTKQTIQMLMRDLDTMEELGAS